MTPGELYQAYARGACKWCEYGSDRSVTLIGSAEKRVVRHYRPTRYPHETDGEALLGDCTADPPEIWYEQQAQRVVELERDRESVVAQLDPGERVVLIDFCDMRGVVEKADGSGGLQVKWDDGTIGYHLLIDVVREVSFEAQENKKELS